MCLMKVRYNSKAFKQNYLSCIRHSTNYTTYNLKDEFNGRMVRVKGHAKVMSHLMFGIVALTVDQLMKFLE